MKRLTILIIMALIFVASIGVGYFYLNTRDDQKKERKAMENSMLTNNTENEAIYTESKDEEKISPNANVTEIVFYKDCGHKIVEHWRVNSSWVNFTRKELENVLIDEKVKNFSEMELVLYKEKEGICPEHFIIGESDGLINIYKINEEGETELYEVTNIYLEYLPDDEKKMIKERIEVIGKEELNAILENLES